MTISTTTGGATIRYTTDGSTPTETAGTVYSTPVSIGATATLKAIAYQTGMTDSSVTSGVYTINTGGGLGIFTGHQDIGSPSPAGSASYTSPTYTVVGGGPDIWGTADAFQFVSRASQWRLHYYRPRGQPAGYRCLGPGGGDDACVAQRRLATCVYVSMPGQRERHGLPLSYSTAGGSTGQSYSGNTGTYWVKLVRSGSNFSAYYSTDGNTWYQQGSTTSIGMTDPIYLGLAVCSHVSGTSCTVTFDNVSVTTANTVAAPTFSPGAGSYGPAQSVTISTTTGGATMRYTTDGSTPSETAGTVYSSPVNISSTCTLKAIAYKSGMTDSSVTSGVYTINGACAAPSFNPAAGTYSAPQAVTISSTTGGTTIRYTTDGSTPSESAGTVYSSPVNISSTCTLKAIAYESGYSDSTVTSGSYTINAGSLGIFTNNQDVGSTGATGSSAYSSGTYTIAGAGADIWGTTDAFQYCYKQMSGNCTIIARVVSVQNTNGNAKAGVMIRSSLNANARHALTDLEPNTTSNFLYRLTDGGSENLSSVYAIAPEWVKVVRSGSNLTGYISTDGSTWTQLGTTQSISMTDPVYVGLVVCSHVSGTLCTATFDNVSVTTP